MRTHIQLTRSYRRTQTARPVARPVVRCRTLARSEIAARYRRVLPASAPSSSWAGFQPDPYVDYGRFLTAEGGILMVYKDFDLSFRHTVWRGFAWTASTGFEGWFLLTHSPVHNIWLNLACLIAMAIINWLIVAKPVEVYRGIEIRPDCMIIGGTDIFWRRYMEGGWPTFQSGQEGQVLCGIYGTRFVEYLCVRRFDEFDRAPEVFAAHLQEAMLQLWTMPQV